MEDKLMACTSLKIVSGDIISRIKVLTVQEPDRLVIDTFHCNEEFLPTGKPMRNEDTRDEETYHRELRAAAYEKGHFIAEESTDPEWNPKLPGWVTDDSGSDKE